VYYASKAYVLSFSEALWSELQGSGVTVTALCPGPVRTPFVDRAQMNELRLFSMMQVMTTEQVAQIGLAAMNAGKRVAVAGFMNRMSAGLAPFTPRALLLPIVKYMQSSRKGA